VHRFIQWPDSTDIATERTNYLTNPSFEGTTLSVSTGGAPSLERFGGPGSGADTGAGDYRLRITGASPAVPTFFVPAGEMSVTPGQWAAFGGHVNRSSAEGLYVALQIQFRTAADVQVALSPVRIFELTSGSLEEPGTHVYTLAQVPEGAEKARVIVRFCGSATSTTVAPPEGWIANADAFILTKSVNQFKAADVVGAYRYTSGGQTEAANGQPYVQITQAIAGHGTATLLAPAGASGRRDVPLLVYCHGAGGGPDHFATANAWAPLRAWAMASGWAVVEGSGGPTDEAGAYSWGNPAAREAYLAYVEWARDELYTGPVVVLGRSMGGIVASWLAARSPIAGSVTGLIMNSAVSTLFVGDGPDEGTNATRATSAYFSNVAAAYGIDNTQPDWYAQLQAAAADHAPENWPVSTWDGRRVLHLYGTADITVPWYPRGGEYMRERWAGRPAVDDVYAVQGGDHSGTGGVYTAVSPMARFLVDIAESVRPFALAYFDGDTGHTDFDHAAKWGGTPHASLSVYGEVIRSAERVAMPAVVTVTEREQESSGVELEPADSDNPVIVYPYSARIAPQTGQLVAIFDETGAAERVLQMHQRGLIAYQTDEYSRLSMVMHARRVRSSLITGLSKDHWQLTVDFTRVEEL
jgi:pimeloyl-ACP methyl ester carboxylesterase